jgi:hypothetical protein
MRSVIWALSMLLAGPGAWGCTSLAPKSPVKAAALCGYAQSPIGERLANLDLQLVLKDKTIIAEAHTDTAGDFRFAPTAKGDYYLISVTRGWQLGWPVRISSSKRSKDCSHPLIVQPALICGGSISKKGYHPKF